MGRCPSHGVDAAIETGLRHVVARQSLRRAGEPLGDVAREDARGARGAERGRVVAHEHHGAGRQA